MPEYIVQDIVEDKVQRIQQYIEAEYPSYRRYILDRYLDGTVDRYRRSHYSDHSQVEQIYDRYDPDWLAHEEETGGIASLPRVNVVVDIDTEIDSRAEDSNTDMDNRAEDSESYTEDSSDKPIHKPIHDRGVSLFKVNADPSEI